MSVDLGEQSDPAQEEKIKLIILAVFTGLNCQLWRRVVRPV